jgi:dienelactone hydrolase
MVIPADSECAPRSGRKRKFLSFWKASLIAAGALAVGWNAAGARGPRVDAKAVFDAPSGPYAIGMRESLWVDGRRGEPFTKDPSDRRRLLVRVWYPAPAGSGPGTAPYILDANELSPQSEYRNSLGVRTNAVLDAPLSKCLGRLPVVVYQPGGGEARFCGTFLAEQLASRGYVVFSADHPGFSETVQFPDGRRFAADSLLMPPPRGGIREVTMAVYEWLDKDVFPTWTADAAFTLDKIADLDAEPGQPFRGRLDLTRIGMVGWSFGGATAAQMGAADPRVKAVVVHDGRLFGDAWKRGTSRPVMLIRHAIEDKAAQPEAEEVIRETAETTRARFRSFLERSRGDWYDLEIAGARHIHFSDYTLFPTFPADPHEIRPRRAHEIIVAYTLGFLDAYLRRSGIASWKEPSGRFPEVTLHKSR